MDTSAFLGLSHSLHVASTNTGQDQFDLNLPAVAGPGTELTTDTISALGTLYLQSELELAGVIPAAEALADARSTLDLPTEAIAQRLEEYATRERNWLDRKSRNLVFARVFGTGASSTDTAANHGFEQRLATVCTSIVQFQSTTPTGGAGDDSLVREAITDLISSLAVRSYGNTLFAVRRIQDQLDASVDLLRSPEVLSLLHVNGFWSAVTRILDPGVPDIGRLVERGQDGQHLLMWIGSSIAALNGRGPLLGGSSPVFEWAASWLSASGVSTSALERSVA
jgi:hypothetical protein